MDQILASCPLTVRALLLAERLDHRGLKRQGPPMPGLIALAAASPGQAFAFRRRAIAVIGAREGTMATPADQWRPRCCV